MINVIKKYIQQKSISISYFFPAKDKRFFLYLVACAVRYFCVALLRRRLSSLERVPAPGAPTPFTTTPCPPFAIFSPINRNSPVETDNFFLPFSPSAKFRTRSWPLSAEANRFRKRRRMKGGWNRPFLLIAEIEIATNDNHESKIKIIYYQFLYFWIIIYILSHRSLETKEPRGNSG